MYVYELQSVAISQMCSFVEIKEAVQRVCFARDASNGVRSLGTVLSGTPRVVSLAAVCCRRASFVVDLARAGAGSDSHKPRVLAKLTEQSDADVTQVLWATALDDASLPALFFANADGKVYCAVRLLQRLPRFVAEAAPRSHS